MARVQVNQSQVTCTHKPGEVWVPGCCTSRLKQQDVTNHLPAKKGESSDTSSLSAASAESQHRLIV
ncbi:MAG: hypothetical protein AAFW70_24020 [Cyanobacteria bacterium J06635_10]